jgi:putative acetyltransferase
MSGVSDDDLIRRPATNADSQAVCNLVASVLREFGLAWDPNGTDADLADVECSYLRAGGSFDLLVDRFGQVVGTVGLFPLADGRAELRKMYLAPSLRGRGLGKLLLQTALDRARQLGFRRVELKTQSSLVGAARLYEAFGFAPAGIEEISERVDRAYHLDLQ